MKLLAISTLLLLISNSCGDDTALSQGLVVNPFSTAVIIDIPASCSYSGKTAQLTVNGQVYTFVVPQCRPKRDLIVISDPQNGNTQTVNVGYQVTGLNTSTSYTAQYVIGTTTFNQTNFVTRTVFPAPPTAFARSGGMVVITVILSIAMFLLIVGLVVVLVLSGRGKK